MTEKNVIDYERVERLHRQNMTATRIAEEVGCDKRTIVRWRAANGMSKASRSIAAPGKPTPAERLIRIEAMLDDGASFSDIQRTLHVSARTLRRYFPGRAWTAEQSGQVSAMTRRMNGLVGHLP